MKYKVTKKQNNSGMCVVCGTQNHHSLGASFYEVEGQIIVALTNAGDEHQSYPDRMHGGMITALIDETIGRAIQITEPDTWGVTSELTIKFRRPTPLNKQIKCVAVIDKVNSRGFTGHGFVEDEHGNLLVTCTATYIKVPLSKLSGDTDEDLGWELVEDKDPVTEIEIVNEV